MRLSSSMDAVLMSGGEQHDKKASMALRKLSAVCEALEARCLRLEQQLARAASVECFEAP